MSSCKKVFLTIILATLLVANAKLIASLFRSNNENRLLLNRIEALTKKSREIEEEFVLKQDYMRKMLTNDDFIEQVIRQKEGYVKKNETVFKFED